MPIKQIENPVITQNQNEQQRKKVMATAENSAALHALIFAPRETHMIDVFDLEDNLLTQIEIKKPEPEHIIPLQRIMNVIRKTQADTKIKIKNKNTNLSEDELNQQVLDSVIKGFEAIEQQCDFINNLLAELTVDDAFDYDAFASGLIPGYIKNQIFIAIWNFSQSKVKIDKKIQEEKVQAGNFRDNGDGAGDSEPDTCDRMDPGAVEEPA